MIGADRDDWRTAWLMTYSAAAVTGKRTNVRDMMGRLNEKWRKVKADDGEPTKGVVTLDEFRAFAEAHNKRVAKHGG